ncbi:MAG TPA: Type 1 glutamine amidotransferase-like domain-containing protein [Microthrixaceae bacterium]|nr:Type 1 glutamine amidotransferase-like domain-containing protein [Microthrixaceae bacterium]
MNGTLVLMGGEEFTDGCTFDSALVEGADEVLLIPAALAYEQPKETIDRARKWFASMDVSVNPLDVYRRAEAMDNDVAELAAAAKLVYVTSGSPMHLRSVLKDTPLLGALVEAWRNGAVIAAAGEATSVLCSHMVDSRGGAYTVGLDLLKNMTVVPRYNKWSPEKWDRTVELAHKGLPVVGIDEATALILSPEGQWSVEGAGGVHVFVDGIRKDLSAIPADLGA